MGTAGYSFIENLPFLDALCMTVIAGETLILIGPAVGICELQAMYESDPG